MIDGIDYYPRNKKRKSKRSFRLVIILFFVLIALVSAYYFFYDGKTPEKPNTSLIVIKEPEIEKTKVIPIIKIHKEQPKKPETLEYLDEIT